MEAVVLLLSFDRATKGNLDRGFVNIRSVVDGARQVLPVRQCAAIRDLRVRAKQAELKGVEKSSLAPTVEATKQHDRSVWRRRCQVDCLRAGIEPEIL